MEGEYNEEEEAAILAETAKKGGHRIDVDKANEIIFALVPLEPEPKAEPDDEPDSDDPADSDDDDLDAILDGPPPELTPTEHSNPAAAEQNDHLAGSGNGRIQKAVARAFIASLRFRFALLNVRQRGTTDARSRPWCAECSALFRRTALAEVGQDFCWPRRGRKNLRRDPVELPEQPILAAHCAALPVQSVALFRSPLEHAGSALSNEHDSA